MTARSGGVLVLGATGFIGRALVKRLAQDRVVLRALVRKPSAAAESLALQGVELLQGDLTNTASLDAALEGIGCVYHLARGPGHSWDDCLRHDIEPTHRLAELCCARGILLCYASSIAIYDGGRAGEVITESTPSSRVVMRFNVYARAKVAIETLLADMQRSRGLKVVIFRPGIVIGSGGDPRHPGVGAWPNALTCRPWGGGNHALPFVWVDDCADAMARALHTTGISGQSFNLVADASLSGNAYLDAFERAAGITIRRRPWLAWRLFAQSIVKWCIKLLSMRREHPLPSYRYCDSLSCRATYSAELAKQRLGWAPAGDTRTLIERGIAAAVSGSAR